jgi:hypothetical protein
VGVQTTIHVFPPDWWNDQKEAALKKMALTDKWANIKYAVEKSDITEHYGYASGKHFILRGLAEQVEDGDDGESPDKALALRRTMMIWTMMNLLITSSIGMKSSQGQLGSGKELPWIYRFEEEFGRCYISNPLNCCGTFMIRFATPLLERCRSPFELLVFVSAHRLWPSSVPTENICCLKSCCREPCHCARSLFSVSIVYICYASEMDR